MRKSLSIFALAISVSVCALAQSGAGLGSISGLVQDATGSSVPGATVVVTDEAKGIKRNLETTSDGQFTAPALTPDAGYKVTVSKGGFANYEATNIKVSVGQNVDLHIALNVASVSTTVVNVTETAAAVEDTKTDVSQLVDSRQILDLPINGRRVDNFVLLTPGVTTDGPFGLISFRGNPGGNSFLTDGNDTTNQFYDENAGRTRTTNIAQDAVQEFQVVTSNFLAEYGRASGGVVNTVTRSGGNTINGTLYWFFRNRTLNATDITANGINPPEWRHQAGMSIGGPIKRDKIFYFFNGELQRRNYPLVSSNTITALSASGPLDANFNLRPTACAAVNGITPTAAQCTAAANYIIDRIKPQLVPRTSDTNLLFGKVDYRPNDRNSISLSVNYLDFRSPNGIQTQLSLTDGNGIGGNADTNVFNRTGRTEWTFVPSASAVNSLRYGFFKDRQYDPASPSLLPSIGPAALTVNGTGSNLGYANGYPRLNPSEMRNQIADTFSWNRGPHAIKFGVDYANIEDYVDRLANRYGTYTYPNFAAFALDFSGNTTGARNYLSYSQLFGNPKVDTKLNEIAFFVQDQWRITPKLIVSPGVRYEHTALPQPTLSNPAFPQTAVIPETNKNFAPRIGIAYTINEKTVVRAGYGLFFNRYTSSTVENMFLTNGLYQATYSLGTPALIAAGGPIFPNPLAAQPTGVAGSSTIAFLDKTWRNPYSHQATVAVERQLAKDTSLTVSYVWSLGLHLLQTRDLNAPTPTTTYTYPILDASNNQVGSYTTPIYGSVRPNSAFGGVFQLESAGKSYYDGLLVQLSRRYSNWLMGNIAYTWSHSIDDNQGGGGNTLFGSTFATSVFNGDYNGEKGNSSSDQRHRLVVNAVLAPTFSQKTDWASRYLINGWQLSVVDIAASSFGITPTINASVGPFLVGATTAISRLSTFSINGLGGSSRVPFEDPAFLKLGDIYRTDARIQKMLPFSERVKVNLFFEAFNVFNHVQVAGPSARTVGQFNTVRQTTGPLAGLTALVPNPSYGTISATQTPPDGTTARRAQVGLRILF
jgi:outer membrane receptor protein involved in Fe transport